MSKFKDIKKILIVRYRFVGDTVLSIPFIKNVKENFPDAKIHFLASPGSGELVENNPCVDKVIYLDTTRFHKYEKGDVIARSNATKQSPAGPLSSSKTISPNLYSSLFSCALALRKEKYDIAFVLKRSFSSAFLAYLSGARHRVGFSTELRSFFLTHRIKYNKQIHESENFLNCLKPLEINPKPNTPKIFPYKEEEIRAGGFLIRLDRNKPKVLIHASSAHPYKMWAKRYFAKLIDELHEKFQAQFVFTGAKEDKQIYEEILSWCKNKNKILFSNLCGLTSLRECYPLYKGLDFAICVDSGNAHIAGATGIPTYVLYGPTRPEAWLPLGEKVYPIRLKQLLPCQPCDVKIECSHVSCMKLLLPDQVVDFLKSKASLLA